MSDLSNLLGDVYGDHSSPDAAPVRHEPAAADRFGGGEDLTAALSAALTAPAPAPAPVAPASAPVAAPAPRPTVDLSAAEAPQAAWTTASAPSISVSAPVPAMAGGSLWAAGDDDIFPSSKGSKKKK